MADRHQPWMKFYPADWRSDPRLRMCSLAARGLWMEMLALMHEAQPYGHLMIAGRHPTDTQLSALVGAPPDQIPDLVRELEAAGVFSRTREKVIFSRRMVADDKKARISRKNGKTGGNPTLCKTKENPAWDNPQDKGVDKTQKPEARYQNITAAAAGGCAGEQEQAGAAVPLVPDTDPGDPGDGHAGLITAFDGAILTVWGQDAVRMAVHSDDATAQKWADAGVTAEMVRSVAERVFRRSRQQNRAPPKALGYLTEPLMEQLTAVATPLLRPRAQAPAVVVGGGDPVDSTWRNRVTGWQRNGFWQPHQWGPAPTTPGCLVPRKILLELRITSEVA